MSIEQTLERIAVALEEIAYNTQRKEITVAPVTISVNNAEDTEVKMGDVVKKVEPAAVATEKSPAIDYKQVRDSILLLQSRKGKSAVKELLTHFGVKAGQELKSEQYAEVIEYANI